jgi:ABC-type uncharacterized transport system substrate-binding protein
MALGWPARANCAPSRHALTRAFSVLLAFSDAAGKRLQLLKELYPGVQRVAVLWNPANRVFAEAGGLVTYGPSFREMARGAGGYVAKILRGASPAQLPVERPTKFELVINLQTAKQIGVTTPAPLLLRADRVIE